MKFFILFLIFSSQFAQSAIPADEYRVGDIWGKKIISQSDFNAGDANFQKLALSMIKINGASGIYLGKFAGKHLIATNHHVCPFSFACLGDSVQFFYKNQKLKIVDFIGTWEQIELSIFVLEPKADLVLAGLGVNFSFDEPITHGQKLLTMGYGGNHNPKNELAFNSDSDCVVFSGNAQYRRLPDHDDPRYETYRAWSFAHGCDASLGDSGSPMMDLKTGKILGLLWSGQSPKKPEIQTSSYLNHLLKFPTDEVWSELSYAVPAIKMKEFLVDEIISGAFPQQKEVVLEALLEQ